MDLPESIKKIDCQVISQSNFMCLSVKWKGTMEYALLDKFNGDQNALEGSLFTMEDGKTENTGSHISVTIHDGKTYVSQVLKEHPVALFLMIFTGTLSLGNNYTPSIRGCL